MLLHNQDLVPMVWMGGSSHGLRTEDEEETKNEPSLIYVSMIPMATGIRAG